MLRNHTQAIVGASIMFVIFWQFRTAIELIIGIPVNTSYYLIFITSLTFILTIIWINYT